MRIIRSSAPHILSTLLLLERLEGALKEKPHLTTKDLCAKGLCPAQIACAIKLLKSNLHLKKAA